MINCIPLVLLLLVSMILLKCKNSPLVIYFLNSVRLFHLQVLYIIILSVSFAIFFRLQLLMITLARKELKNFFLYGTSQTHFIFNSKFYNQIDVVAMGSLLAPVLANVFMGFQEFKWLNKYNLKKSKFISDMLMTFQLLLTENKIY